MIQQCLDLALGRAFAPDPLDSTVPLARRFAKRPLIAVTLYKDGFEVVPVTFAGGAPVFGTTETATFSSEEADAAFLRAVADRYKARECLVNLTTGYTAILSSRTRRPENDDEAILLMRENPERLLGEPPAQGCRHSLAYHPTHNFAVVFSHKDNDINAAVGLVARSGLAIARLQCGASSLLNYVLDHFWTEVGREAELLLVDRASLFYLPVAEGSFGRPLFDVGLKEAALKQAITERIGKLKPGGKIILIDTSGLEVAAMIKDKVEGANVVVPMEGQSQAALLACCNDKPHLGYDLFPGERAVRPFAPARLRIVPIIFWAATGVSIVLIGANLIRGTRDDSVAKGFKNQTRMLTEGKKRAEGVKHDIEAHGRTAAAICNWLVISPPTQALLINLTKEIESATDQGLKENKSVAQIDSLAITRQEGQPQMRLVLVVLGDSSAANRVFQRIAALFGRMGYSTVDLKETLVPQGFRYEHLLNMPKP